ncbi:MAG: thiamine pyrophosphate-dependent enzyme [Planctomycetota bacterium]
MAEPVLGGIALSEKDRAEPVLRPGNTNCGGCGMSLALQLVRRALGGRPVQMVIPACCGIVAAGQYPYSNFGVPIIASTFASTAAVASGLAWVAKLNNERTRVLCWAGDGGTYDIGMATLSAAAERNDDILYLCYDNEIYGNTGGQGSSATPLAASTTTTPGGKRVEKKDILGIMAAHRIPYVATLSMAHLDDFMRKVRYALDTEGTRFLHILSPCPTGWKSEPSEGVALLRLAVRCGLYPVYEVFDGTRHVINVESELDRNALETYFSRQGRYRHSEISTDTVYEAIKRHWRKLRQLARTEP